MTLSSKLPRLPAMVTVVWFPMTRAATIISASDMTGFTFPGMIDEPGWIAGSLISWIPEVGPLPSHRMSSAIFMSPVAIALSAPDALTAASFAACASKWSSASRKSMPVQLGDLRDRPPREGRVGVDPGARRGPAQRQLGQLLGGPARTLDALGDLGGVAAELLAEPHRRRVHQVGAAGLHDPVERLRLVGERGPKVVEPRDELLLDRDARRHVDRRRDHVVRRLREVHVVVGMDLGAEDLRRAVRDHLVGVHVRGRPRPGLVDVEDELVVPFPRHHLGGRGDDRLRDRRVDAAHVGVHERGGLLDRAQRLDEAPAEALAADGEVLERALGLGAVQGRLGHLHLAQRVLFDPVSVSHGEARL